MKAGDLLGREIVDAAGVPVGRVFDLRAASDGETEPGTWTLTHMLVGPRAALFHMGYGRREMSGPPGIPALGRRLRGYLVNWSDVEDVGTKPIRLRLRIDDLRTLELDGA